MNIIKKQPYGTIFNRSGKIMMNMMFIIQNKICVTNDKRYLL
jgi:hypothetical protein